MTQILSYTTAPSVIPLVTYDAGEGCEFWVWRTAANYVVGLYDVDANVLLDGVRMFNAAEFDAAEQAAVYAMTQAAKSLTVIQGSR